MMRVYMGCCICIDVICGRVVWDLTTLNPLAFIRNYFLKILIPWYLLKNTINRNRIQEKINSEQKKGHSSEQGKPYNPCYEKGALRGMALSFAEAPYGNHFPRAAAFPSPQSYRQETLTVKAARKRPLRRREGRWG